MILYRAFAFLGLMVVSASLLYGFRHEAGAPASNYLFDAGLFAVYMLVHFVMMQPGFKRLISGSEAGGEGERRIYIAVSVVTWLAIVAIHRPLPGPVMEVPGWIQFAGLCGFLLSFFAFLEGGTFGAFAGFLGVPGTETTHSAAAETPLNTSGSYASVRHPMYRGAVLMCLASIVVHPNAAQLVWALALAATWVSFIPIEERQLRSSKPQAYADYMEATPYRLFRGVW
jgi:protein-S-isoprenylcysteine O-methyltransferase Ste14